MPNIAAIEDLVNVALLYQTSQLEGHLKDALKDLGAAVVYEALTAEMDRDALEGSGAHVVIVNLDPEIEAHLDEVYDLLDDQRYNVVFNDAQVSVGLSGWEQARWSRHLAAKIMGKPEVSDPPRPAGSHAPPSPAQKTAKAIPDALRSAPTLEYVPDAATAALYPPDGDLGMALGELLAHADAQAGPYSLSPPQADPGAIRRAEFDVPAPSNADPGHKFDDFAADITPSKVPVPAPRRQTETPDFAAELDSLLGDIPTASIAGTSVSSAAEPAARSASAFGAELDALAGDAERALNADHALTQKSPPADRVSAFFNDLSTDAAKDTSADFDFSGDLDALFEPIAPAQAEAAPSGPSTDFDLDLDALFAEPAKPLSRASAPTLELPSPFRDNMIDPGADSGDFEDVSIDLSSSAELSEPGSFDTDFPALFDNLDTPTPAARRSPTEAASTPTKTSNALSDWSLDALDEPAPDAAAAQAAAAAVPGAAERFGVEKRSAEDFLAGGSWSLEEVSDGAATDAAKSTDSQKFGVEKVAAQDFLAPEGGDAKGYDFSSLGELDLVPLEDAVAPHVNRPELVSEHRLDDAVLPPKAGAIRNVVVLGASIGGPEAVREFLAALPARFPALFVLAQHMGAEFLELMAAQLAKATKLTVRTASHGERLSHGEVIVVPTTHRLLIDAEGVVQLAQLPESSPYSPSIDLVLRDVADRFGAAATAIIFSGMAHDAIDGSKHLAGKGGKIWVQDPDTCVISSMVDGAREAGVVTFIGAPAQLAQQTIATYGKA